jgi:hypothetical protein
MNAIELRMGNWVYDGECKMNLQIGTGLHLHRLHEDSLPIPLTKEWLAKFGFKYDKTGDLSIMLNSPDTHLFFVKAKEWFYPNILSEPEYSNMSTSCVGINRIQHVHQLQNLYFALTGKELEIK